MDVALLSRLQFAVATYFPFSLCAVDLGSFHSPCSHGDGLWRTGDEDYKLMTKFWGRLFILNFGLGCDVMLHE